MLTDDERAILDRLREARDVAARLDHATELTAAIEVAVAATYARLGARVVGHIEQLEHLAEQVALAADAADGATRRGAQAKVTRRKDGSRTVTLTLDPEPVEAPPPVEVVVEPGRP